MRKSSGDLPPLHHLPRAEKLKLLALLEERQRREKYNKLRSMFPDTGEFRRELYSKHCEFFTAGAYHSERLFMAGNRVGKTEAGGYEITLHLTGEYPEWWNGKRFDRNVRALAAGDTNQTTRDIIQKKLLGGKYGTDAWGTGMIPRDKLGKPTPKPGVPDAYEEVPVKHANGEWSVLKFRTYEQGRKIFQGTEEDIIWMDEECPYPVYEEALIRTMTTNGIFILTFTPLSGLTELVLAFLESCKEQALTDTSNPRYMVKAGWDHAPHLSKEQQERLIKSLKLKPYQLKARMNGDPSLGEGAIYPYDPDDIKVNPFMLPKHWPKAYGFDVGWKRTAVVWGAWDRDNDIVYLYSEHYMGQVTPAEHAAAIKARGTWMLGAIDPASKGRAQTDGSKLFELYELQGLNIMKADNAVEAGIFAVNERLATGRLKVFGTLANLLAEFALYRRDDKGHVVKENDHLMDAMRYLIMMLVEIMTTPPVKTAVRGRTEGDWRGL
ncbi:hypothetical protein GJQ54_05295 [Oceanospirillaceae bacterium ASx5O]|nr:hypothetical protein GJQ54_05295 [Oceanospirillaceae bacterium ASx5O]